MYLCLTKLHKVSGMNRFSTALRWVFSMYVQRYLRLLPVVVFCLGYVLWLLPYNGKGPMWETGLERSERATCFKSFWTNLLFINNLYPHQFGAEDPDGLGCMSWSWIFAVDIQLFLLVPLLALLFRRMDPSSKMLPFWLTVSALTVSSVLAYWFTAWEFSLSAVCETVFQGFEAPAAVLTRAYNKPWTRAVPYLLGVCLAAFLERFRGQGKPLWSVDEILPCVEKSATRKALAYTTLGLAFVAHFASIFMPATAFISSGPDQGQCAWGRAANAFFLAFRHCLYGLSLLVIATVCTLNCGGWIGWVARRPFWIPLGRVAYCVYMVTPIILIVTIFSSPFRSSFATTTQASACVSNGVFGVVFGSVLYFLVDRPAKNLMLLITREDY